MEKEMVFISWSGPRSKAIAQALYDWLPRIIQPVNPWMSEHDIHKGTRWSSELARELEKARFGLSCLTPENLNAPWLLFETGAIAKAVEEAYVWTYLFDLEYTDIKGPLAQFNHTKADKDDTKRLVRSINKAVGGAIRESDFDETFEKWWPELDQHLRLVPPAEEEPKLKRSQDDMLEEILLTVRGLAQRPVTDKTAMLDDVRPLIDALRAAELDESRIALVLVRLGKGKDNLPTTLRWIQDTYPEYSL